MCLMIDRGATARVKQAPEETVTRYKIVFVAPTEDSLHTIGIPPHIGVSSYYHTFYWKNGWNEAETAAYDLCMRGDRITAGAIHVYTDIESAKASVVDKGGGKILPVKCNTKDLVAVGTYEDFDGICHITVASEAYTKVFVDDLEKDLLKCV